MGCAKFQTVPFEIPLSECMNTVDFDSVESLLVEAVAVPSESNVTWLPNTQDNRDSGSRQCSIP
eukprot:1421856-Amphidinium_carterae.2